MKKNIIKSTILLLVVYSLWILNKNFLMWWDVTTLNVHTDKKLSSSKVKIELLLLGNRTVLYDGEVKNSIPQEYGENDFILTYDKKYFLKFRHFKFNRRHQHSYDFYFYKKGEKIFVDVDIEGADDMEFIKELKNSKER